MSGSTPPTFMQRLQRRLRFGTADASGKPSPLALLQAAEARTRQLELQLGDVLLLLRSTEERTRTLEHQLREHEVALAAQAEVQRATEERTRTIEHQLAVQEATVEQQLALQRTAQERTKGLEAQQQHVATAAQDGLALLRVAEERTRTLEAHLLETLSLAHTGDERTRTLEAQLRDAVSLARAGEERTRTLEHLIKESANLVRVTEERSRSQHFELQQARFASSHELDLLHKWYVESPDRPGALESLRGVVQGRALRLETAHPIAEGSNDHLAPESTQEGIARPTAFISHCIDLIGAHRSLLDLGTGAGGLVYEALMQGLVAIGLDGSDHCRRRRIGYWPLLPDNLRTCDATQPFRFQRDDGQPLVFGLVTAWEMLEHIPAEGVPGLLRNVHDNLAPGGYFVGSVSLVEYEADGVPYHVTLQPPDWWRDRMQEAGLEWLDAHPFDARLFYRGNGPRFQDFHNYFSHPEEGFHFVARRNVA